MELANTVAVVTGGASGLGRAAAEAIVAGGGAVAIVDRNAPLAAQTAEEIGGAAFAADVSDADSVQAAIEAIVERFGAIHININCAGIAAAGRTVGRDGPLPLAAFERVIRVNLVGTFNVLRLCAEAMGRNAPLGADGERGVIVNTASVAAFDGQIGQAAYAASKSGVAGMTLPIARDLARSGVRVCTIAPGVFETPMVQGMTEQVREPLIGSVQFPNRLGVAAEYGLLARQIIENPYLNGETIRLDGGIRMQPR